MAVDPGTYKLGPEDGRLSLRTSRVGAAARAGHDLLIEVERWGATVELAPDPAKSVLELTADPTSLKVLEGSGGIKPLSEGDKAEIARTIDEKVLKRAPITFRSTAVRPEGEGRFRVTGDLELANGVNLVAFDIDLSDDGSVAGSAVVRQTEWGVKPYRAMMGALKVADEVEVAVEAKLRPAS